MAIVTATAWRKPSAFLACEPVSIATRQRKPACRSCDGLRRIQACGAAASDPRQNSASILFLFLARQGPFPTNLCAEGPEVQKPLSWTHFAIARRTAVRNQAYLHTNSITWASHGDRRRDSRNAIDRVLRQPFAQAKELAHHGRPACCSDSQGPRTQEPVAGPVQLSLAAASKIEPPACPTAHWCCGAPGREESMALR